MNVDVFHCLSCSRTDVDPDIVAVWTEHEIKPLSNVSKDAEELPLLRVIQLEERDYVSFWDNQRMAARNREAVWLGEKAASLHKGGFAAQVAAKRTCARVVLTSHSFVAFYSQSRSPSRRKFGASSWGALC